MAVRDSRDSVPRETALPVDERRLREALAQLDGMHRALTTLLGRPSGEDAGDAIRAAIAELPEARPAIRLLGAFSVEFNGRPVTLSAGGKSVAVLKFLAASGTQTVPRDRILDALWPEVPASVAASRLRSALHALRRVFADQGGVQGTRGGEVVAYDHGQYLLFPGTLLVTDVDLFEDAWARGQEYDRAGERGLAVASYERAERLYRGDFLEQDAYLDWTSVRREQLRDAYLTLLARLAHLYIERGEDMAAISCCHKLLRRDDCNEEAYRLLIEAHGRRGDRNAALRWYDICERELARVLGMPPSEGTRAAREAVLSATGGTEPVRLATAG
ncbi:MAG: winged helix-turn-helix domain-containing protein [Dehalococcoidia bacterium]|nr:winged helix-turn-helix domain-containing protein [Dehalococcoidia bacterium]